MLAEGRGKWAVSQKTKLTQELYNYAGATSIFLVLFKYLQEEEHKFA